MMYIWRHAAAMSSITRGVIRELRLELPLLLKLHDNDWFVSPSNH